MAFKPGEVVCGKYEVLTGPLVGGQAYIYQAQDIESGTMVALKILKDEFAFAGNQFEMKARFRLEATLHRLLSQHPNILKMLGTDFIDLDDGMNQLICLFEWIEGSLTLEVLLDQYRQEREERLARGGIKGKPGPCVPLPLVLGIMRQVAEAIAFAHSENVLHRDLKPANILLIQEPNGEWTAKVADFGIAKVLDQLPATHKLTKTGTSLGTPDYMSPEQGSTMFKQCNDIWAFWIIMYELLTGQLPYKGQTLGQWAAIWYKIQNERLAYEPIDALVDEVPEELQLMIRAGLNPTPDQRPSMKETAMMLKQMCGDLDRGTSKTELHVVVHSSKPPVFDPMAQTADPETMARALPAAQPEKPKSAEAPKLKVVKRAMPPATPQRVSKPVNKQPGVKKVPVKTGNPLPKPTPQSVVVPDRVSASPTPQDLRVPLAPVVGIAAQMASQPIMVFEETAPRTAQNQVIQVIPPPARKPANSNSWLVALVLAGVFLLAVTVNLWLPAMKRMFSHQAQPATADTAVPSGQVQPQVPLAQPNVPAPDTAFAPPAPVPSDTDWSKTSRPAANPLLRPVRPGPRPAGHRTEPWTIEGLPPGAPPPENQ